MRILGHKLTRSLSDRRNSRFAAPLVLLLALLTCGGFAAALTPADASNTKDDAAQIAKGRALFQVGCSSCHGLNGEGVQTKRGTQYGPPLVGVGAAAVDFQVGTGRMPMAQPGSQALKKKPEYTESDTQALAAYVASLGPGPAIPSKQDYNTGDLSAEEIARGGRFFRTNCTACHNFIGAGGALSQGKFAPSLKDVSEKHIYEALETGPQNMPSFSDGSLPPQAKREVIGYIRSANEAPSYGGFSLGSLGPVAEGLFAWIAGIGGLVCVAVWIAAHTARSTKDKKKVDV